MSDPSADDVELEPLLGFFSVHVVVLHQCVDGLVVVVTGDDFLPATLDVANKCFVEGLARFKQQDLRIDFEQDEDTDT